MTLKYFPRFTDYPRGSPHLDAINNAAGALEGRLRNLRCQDLPVSDYCKRYYAYDLRKLTFMLQAKPAFFCKLLEVMTNDDTALCLSPQGFSNVDPATDIFNNTNQQFWE
jgi:hypothetical protein